MPDPTPATGKPGMVCEQARVGSGHCAQPSTLAASVEWAVPGAGINAISMQGCGWTRCTAYSFCCRHLHLDKGNMAVPGSLETPRTTEPQRGCHSSDLTNPSVSGPQKAVAFLCFLLLVMCSVGGHVSALFVLRFFQGLAPKFLLQVAGTSLRV